MCSVLDCIWVIEALSRMVGTEDCVEGFGELGWLACVVELDNEQGQIQPWQHTASFGSEVVRSGIMKNRFNSSCNSNDAAWPSQARNRSGYIKFNCVLHPKGFFFFFFKRVAATTVKGLETSK